MVLISKSSIREIKPSKFLRFTVARGNIPSSHVQKEREKEQERELKRKKSQNKEGEHVRKKGSVHTWGLIYKTVCKIHTKSAHAHNSQKCQVPKSLLVYKTVRMHKSRQCCLYKSQSTWKCAYYGCTILEKTDIALFFISVL